MTCSFAGGMFVSALKLIATVWFIKPERCPLEGAYGHPGTDSAQRGGIRAI